MIHNQYIGKVSLKTTATVELGSGKGEGGHIKIHHIQFQRFLIN
jgi:hypothetical protein